MGVIDCVALTLMAHVGLAAVKYGIEEIPSDVVALISHATQERLKTLVQKLGIVAEHRLENIKVRKNIFSFAP